MSEDLSGFSMMELFRMEADSHTTTLTSGLVALEGGLATPAAIEPLMRAAHSLKGAARIVGLDAAVRVAHAMEDCLVAAQKGKLVLEPAHVDVLLQGVDLLVQIAQIDEPEIEEWQSEHTDTIDAFVAAISAIQEGKASPPTQESTSPVHAVTSETQTQTPSSSDTAIAIVAARMPVAEQVTLASVEGPIMAPRPIL